MRQLIERVLGLRPPLAPVAALREGLSVTVRGVIVPRDLIDSPLTGDRCVYYRYTVEEWRRAAFSPSGSFGFWHPIERDEAIAEFYLQDDDGRVIVAPQRARVETSRGGADANVELGVAGRRAHQLLLSPGDRVEVSAAVAPVDDLYDDARDYRGDARRWALVARPMGELVVRLL